MNYENDQTSLKGTVSQDFLSPVFLFYNFSWSHWCAQKQFQISPNIRGVIRIRNWFPGNESTRE